jgi:hypothetical protein
MVRIKICITIRRWVAGTRMPPIRAWNRGDRPLECLVRRVSWTVRSSNFPILSDFPLYGFILERKEPGFKEKVGTGRGLFHSVRPRRRLFLVPFSGRYDVTRTSVSLPGWGTLWCTFGPCHGLTPLASGNGTAQPEKKTFNEFFTFLRPSPWSFLVSSQQRCVEGCLPSLFRDRGWRIRADNFWPFVRPMPLHAQHQSPVFR